MGSLPPVFSLFQFFALLLSIFSCSSSYPSSSRSHRPRCIVSLDLHAVYLLDARSLRKPQTAAQTTPQPPTRAPGAERVSSQGGWPPKRAGLRQAKRPTTPAKRHHHPPKGFSSVIHPGSELGAHDSCHSVFFQRRMRWPRCIQPSERPSGIDHGSLHNPNPPLPLPSSPPSPWASILREVPKKREGRGPTCDPGPASLA